MSIYPDKDGGFVFRKAIPTQYIAAYQFLYGSKSKQPMIKIRLGKDEAKAKVKGLAEELRYEEIISELKAISLISADKLSELKALMLFDGFLLGNRKFNLEYIEDCIKQVSGELSMIMEKEDYLYSIESVKGKFLCSGMRISVPEYRTYLIDSLKRLELVKKAYLNPQYDYKLESDKLRKLEARSSNFILDKVRTSPTLSITEKSEAYSNIQFWLPLVTIAKTHTLQNFTNPVTSDLVKLTLRGIRRLHGKADFLNK